MARIIYFSFLLIVVVNEFPNYEVCGRLDLSFLKRHKLYRHHRDVDEISEWLGNAKNDVLKWGSNKNSDEKEDFAIPETLDKHYEELKLKLAEKTEDLKRLPLWKNIERLQSEAFSDESNLHKLKEKLAVFKDDANEKLEEVKEKLEEYNPELTETLKELSHGGRAQVVGRTPSRYQRSIQKKFRHRRDADEISQWIGNAKNDVVSWGSNKYSDVKDQLNGMRHWKGAERLENAVHSDDSSLHKLKEKLAISLGDLKDVADEKFEDLTELQGQVNAREKLFQLAKEKLEEYNPRLAVASRPQRLGRAASKHPMTIQRRTRIHRDLSDVNEWFKEMKDSVWNWGSDKYNNIKNTFEDKVEDVEKASENLEKHYEEVKIELAKKLEELKNLQLWKDIERLENALLSDEAGVQHVKEKMGNTMTKLRDVADEQIKNLQGTNPAELLSRLAKEKLDETSDKPELLATPFTPKLRATPFTPKLLATPFTPKLLATPFTPKLRATPFTLKPLAKLSRREAKWHMVADYGV